MHSLKGVVAPFEVLQLIRLEIYCDKLFALLTCKQRSSAALQAQALERKGLKERGRRQGARGEGSGEMQEEDRGGVASFVAESPLAPSFACPSHPSCHDALTGIQTRVQHTQWQGPDPSHRPPLRGPL